MMDSGKLININLKRNLNEVTVLPGNVESHSCDSAWILADTDLIPRT